MDWNLPCANNRGLATLAVGVLAVSGCFSPYHYAPQNPYGPAYAPAYPGVGGPAMTVPGQPGFQPGLQPGYPTQILPEGTLQPAPDPGFGPVPNNGGLLPGTPGGGNSLPPSGPTGNNGGYDGNIPVPNYGDAPGGPAGGTFEGNQTPFGPGANLQPPASGVGNVAYVEGEPGRLSAGTIQNSQPLAAPGTIAVTAGSGTSTPNPFDYDPQGYRWLRGVVDYDQVDQTWILFYSSAPNANDPLKGRVALLDHPQLNNLKDGDVVYVEGRLDAQLRDPRSGLPKYRVSRLQGPLAVQ